MESDDNKHDLTPEERAKIAEHLSTKAPDLACPICQSKSFSVLDLEVAPPPVTRSGSIGITARKHIPLVMIGCDNCFHVLHFAAAPLGIGRSSAKVETESEDSNG